MQVRAFERYIIFDSSKMLKVDNKHFNNSSCNNIILCHLVGHNLAQ